MKVRYSPRARDDLDQIYSDLSERSALAATAVLKRIQDRVEQLADLPLMAPGTELPEVRGSIGRYPYKAYYHVMDDEVLILHVPDLRRTPRAGEN